MDTILYLIIGLIVGAGLGWLLASRSKAGASPDGQIALADAKARVELLQQQVTQLETDR